MSTKSNRHQHASQASSSQSHEQQPVTSSERPSSPLSPQIKTRLEEKNTPQNLNDYLAKYIDTVRIKDNQTNLLSEQLISSQESLTREVFSTKTIYEKEIRAV